MPTTSHSAGRARSAVFAPIGEPGRAVLVEQRLGHAIRAGLLADGERLPSEPRLAQMLGVSTMTAREALGGLRALGLVTTVRGRGGGSFVTRPPEPDDAVLRTRLTNVTRAELVDRGALFAALISGATEFAAARTGPDDLAELRGVLSAPDADTAQVRRADLELHLWLAGFSQSGRLARAVLAEENDFGPLLRLPVAVPDVRAQLVMDHHNLLDAISEGQIDTARRHVRDSVRRLLVALSELHAEVR